MTREEIAWLPLVFFTGPPRVPQPIPSLGPPGNDVLMRRLNFALPPLHPLELRGLVASSSILGCETEETRSQDHVIVCVCVCVCVCFKLIAFVNGAFV
jgi:hypothetical protein